MLTNEDKIHSLYGKELADFLKKTFDPDEEYFGCFLCTSYGTHHYTEEFCGDCEYWGVHSIEDWLKRPYKES